MLIRQAIANRTLDRTPRALGIVHAQTGQVRIVIIKLGQIRLQVLFDAVTMCTVQAAVENAQKPLDAFVFVLRT